jgi:hypothetical protein
MNFEMIVSFTAIGVLAIFIYWLIAGRHAGLWKRPVA